MRSGYGRHLWQASATLVVLVAVGCPAGAAAEDWYGLQPGQAEVRLAPGLSGFAPVVGAPLHLEIIARLRRPKRTESVWLRYQSPKHGCASSFATDRGLALKQERGRFPTPLAAIEDAHGDLHASPARRQLWRKPGKVRFCMWFTTRPTRRVHSATSIVRFYDDLFAVAVARTGSLDPSLPSIVWNSAASFPYRQDADAPVPPIFGSGCEDNIISNTASQLDEDGVFGQLGGFTGIGTNAGPCPIITLSYSKLSGQNVATLSFSDAEGSPLLPGVIGFGGCLLMDTESTVAEVEHYLDVLGCRVNRVINRPVPASPTSPAIGEVYRFEQDGGSVALAPTGTSIDLIVNG